MQLAPRMDFDLSPQFFTATLDLCERTINVGDNEFFVIVARDDIAPMGLVL